MLSCSLDRTDSVKTIKSDQANKEVYGVTPNGLEKLSKPIKLKSREKLKEERGELQLEKELKQVQIQQTLRARVDQKKRKLKKKLTIRKKRLGIPY